MTFTSVMALLHAGSTARPAARFTAIAAARRLTVAQATRSQWRSRLLQRRSALAILRGGNSRSEMQSSFMPRRFADRLWSLPEAAQCQNWIREYVNMRPQPPATEPRSSSFRAAIWKFNSGRRRRGRRAWRGPGRNRRRCRSTTDRQAACARLTRLLIVPTARPRSAAARSTKPQERMPALWRRRRGSHSG